MGYELGDGEGCFDAEADKAEECSIWLPITYDKLQEYESDSEEGEELR